MPNQALVTGATGVIGTTLCRELDSQGWSVTALRRESSNTDRLSDVPVEWATADVRDHEALRGIVEGQSHVFHLAGIGLLDADEDTVWDVNLGGTRNLVKACRDSGIERILFTSTAGVFRDDGPADESDRAPPLGVYQRSKDRAEMVLETSPIETVTVHPTSVFAPGDPAFTARLLQLATDPKMVAYLPGGASIVSVDDVVDGIIAAMEDGMPGENYVLGGENLSYREALETIARYAGTTPPAVEVPRAAILAMGPVAGTVNRTLGTSMFPVNTEMARLATQKLFYDSTKAANALDYSHQPFAAFVEDALNWYGRTNR